MTKLEGRVALVTGGARGLGAAAARALAGEGAKVVVSDIGDGTETANANTQWLNSRTARGLWFASPDGATAYSAHFSERTKQDGRRSLWSTSRSFD